MWGGCAIGCRSGVERDPIGGRSLNSRERGCRVTRGRKGVLGVYKGNEWRRQVEQWLTVVDSQGLVRSTDKVVCRGVVEERLERKRAQRQGSWGAGLPTDRLL